MYQGWTTMYQGWTTLPEYIRAGLHYLNVSVEDSMFWSLGESRPELPIVWVHNLSIGKSAYVISAKGTVLTSGYFNETCFLTPEYSIRDIYIFFQNYQRYSKLKVHHWYKKHRWPHFFLRFTLNACACAANAGHKFAAGISGTGGQSTTSINDTSVQQWKTISECLHLTIDIL